MNGPNEKSKFEGPGADDSLSPYAAEIIAGLIILAIILFKCIS